jgi:sulfate transport system ATP-binding protein
LSPPRQLSNGAFPRSSGPPDAGKAESLFIDGLSKSFGRFPALNKVSLAAEGREFLALLGPSGSGKTTLLRLLAGLETPDAGEVRFGGRDFLAIAPRRRRVGMVFQHYALFRHMTVAQNIAFGLRVRPKPERPSSAEIEKRVDDLLSLIQLAGLGGRYPAQLSGGQRQRVALARALAIEPQLLLLDEPFGALDARVRRDLRRWLREMHDRAGVATIFVTHDQDEALDLADRVAILKDGELVQLGAPQALYGDPKTAFVYDFLGPSCRLPAVVDGGWARVADWSFPAQGAAAGEAEAFFRPDEIELSSHGVGFSARVTGVSGRGTEIRIDCVAEGRGLELRTRGPVPAGEMIRVRPLRPKLYPREAAEDAS